jgi:hypothetical protein
VALYGVSLRIETKAGSALAVCADAEISSIST